MYITYEELLRKAQEFDTTAEQPNCEDPAKMEFMNKALKHLQNLDKRLSSIEERLDNSNRE